jgi:hypothetical protein
MMVWVIKGLGIWMVLLLLKVPLMLRDTMSQALLVNLPPAKQNKVKLNLLMKIVPNQMMVLTIAVVLTAPKLTKPDNLTKIPTHLTKIPQGYPGKLNKLSNKHLTSSKTHQTTRELPRDLHKEINPLYTTRQPHAVQRCSLLLLLVYYVPLVLCSSDPIYQQ